ncbi:MAG: hypothetical protein Crog4KO_24290 [Crocinitomicaceae bacterium]
MGLGNELCWKKESMSTTIKPTFQIQRINALENRLKSIQELNSEKLMHRPKEKSWSAIEVAKHMVIGHNAYTGKVKSALEWQSKTTEVPSEFQASSIPSFLIKRFPPQAGKIKFKMKTTKKFKPVLDLESIDASQLNAILEELDDVLKELKSWVEVYRGQPVSMKKFNSALGPIVRFNIPEACEFILCHNERHFLQMERAIESAN